MADSRSDLVRRLLRKRRFAGTGGPLDEVRSAIGTGTTTASPDVVRQLQDVMGTSGQSGESEPTFDYDDIVQQSFPASDPPPPPSRETKKD